MMTVSPLRQYPFGTFAVLSAWMTLTTTGCRSEDADPLVASGTETLMTFMRDSLLNALAAWLL